MTNLLRAARALILACTACFFLTPLSAMTVHVCSGGCYTQTEIWSDPNGNWHSRTTEMGGCTGDWSYVEYLAVPTKLTLANGFGVAEADSGRTLPKTDPAFVNLSTALTKAVPVAQRKVTTKIISASDAQAMLALARANRPLILQLPVSTISDPRCYAPFAWNGFACVDNSTAPVSLPIPLPPSIF